MERERKVRKRGRSVAIAAAVIPIPGSTVDQMATSVVEYRKSLLKLFESALPREVELWSPSNGTGAADFRGSRRVNTHEKPEVGNKTLRIWNHTLE